MKNFLLTLFLVLASVAGIQAQTFEWGTASWNIADGTEFDGIDEFSQKGLVLSFTNPADYALTFLNIIAVDYDLYIDGSTEAVNGFATGQGSTDVSFRLDAFAEGHQYRLVATKATLVQANLATFQTDTLTSTVLDLSVSFTVKGPELVKTIEVEATQALTITNQYNPLTFSLIDTDEVKELLGIQAISEAQVYGLNPNGSYNAYHASYYDGWHDVDGEYTTYYGGWDSYNSHNAYPAVYCIKINETADTVSYFFYDYWRPYDPEEADTVGGSGVLQARREAPETSYNSIIWDAEPGDSVSQYIRSYRVDEGSDYKAGFVIIANKKYVRINATLHFVSQEDYAALQNKGQQYEGFVAVATTMPQAPGTPVAPLSTQEQTVTITEAEEAGKVNITFSGFSTAVPFPLVTGEIVLAASVTKDANGVLTYSSEPVQIGLTLGQMIAYYNVSVKGVQTSESDVPVLVVSLAQAATVTAAFNATADLATAALNEHYTTITAVDAVRLNNDVSIEVYSLNGVRRSGLQKGFNLVKKADGTLLKLLMK